MAIVWDEEDLEAPIALWETAEKLEEDEEQVEKFYQEQNVDILLSIEKFQQKRPPKSLFFRRECPTSLETI